jgi:putative membrane protein
MSELGRALLSWGWRADVTAVLALLTALYVLGWRRLRQLGHRPTTGWRLGAYLAGVLLLGLALMSPIDALGQQLFWMHMVQHLLLVMLAPPLLFLGAPFPTSIWGLPRQGRLLVARLLNQRSSLRALLMRASSPGIVWFVFVALLVGWHDPAAYDAALRSELIHDLEHLCFFGIGILYWWRLIGAAPLFSRRMTPLQRIIYALAVVPPNMLVGVVLSFAAEPTYLHYLTVPRISSLTVLQDQHFGGLLMWVPGSMMYIMVALFYVYKAMGDDPPASMETAVADSQVRAPGFDR